MRSVKSFWVGLGMAVACLLTDPAWLRADDELVEQKVQTDIARTTKETLDKMQKLKQTLEERPRRLEANRWDSVLAGAEEISRTVTRLKDMRTSVREAVEGISGTGARMRTGLDQLEKTFLELADEAQKEADGTGGQAALPGSLLPIIEREVVIYRKGAAVCNVTAKSFASGLADQKEKLALVERCGPLLDRMDRAARNYADLAKIGQQFEQAQEALASFADQLNKVLDLLENMAKGVQDAVAHMPHEQGSAKGKRASPVRPSRTPVRSGASSLHRAPSPEPKPDTHAEQETNQTASLTFLVPEDAELWLQGVCTSQRGATRSFVTPVLDPDNGYRYEVTVSWVKDGRKTTRQREVVFRMGNRLTFDVLSSPGWADQDDLLVAR